MSKVSPVNIQQDTDASVGVLPKLSENDFVQQKAFLPHKGRIVDESEIPSNIGYWFVDFRQARFFGELRHLCRRFWKAVPLRICPWCSETLTS